MNYFKTNKLIAFLSLFFLLFFSFLLVSGIQKLFLSNPGASSNSIYIYVTIIILLGINLFVISINLTYKNLTGEVSATSGELIAEEETENSQDFIENQQKTDINLLVKKIMPKEGADKNLEKYSEKLLINIAKELDIVQGLIFFKNKKSGMFEIAGKYAYYSEEDPKNFKEGETLSGQAAKNKKLLNLTELPDNYITVLSGLGSSSPKNLLIIPILSEGESIGIIELASFKIFDENTEKNVTELAGLIGENVKKHLNS